MFKILENLTKAVIGAATLPVTAAADIVTLGGATTDKERTYTGERLGDIMDNLKEAVKSEEPTKK
jgi:hypothetical protein